MKRSTPRGVPFFAAASLSLALSAGLALADDAAELFSSLDKNSDGKLERSEVPEEQIRHFERMLRSGDKDKDGILTKEEFSSAATAPEAPVTPPSGEGRPGGGPGGPGRPNPEEMFRRLDKDGNGRISREEIRSSEAPEPIKGFLGRLFDELKKDELTPDDMRQARERMGREGGPGGAGGGRMMLDRLRQLDKNKDGKVSREELQDVPAEGRERLTQMMERTGRDEIDIARMEEMMAQGGPGGRPAGSGPRPNMREGGRPAAEGDRPREGQRPEGGPRDGDRRPEGPRDGEARPGQGPRDGERRPEGPRDGDGRPGQGPRDGDRRPEGGPRDGEGRPFRPQLMQALDANDDGRISREELQNAAAHFDRLDRNQDGHIDMAEAFGPPQGGPGRGMGPQDGRRPEGDRPRGEGDRPRPEGDRPRPEGDRPRGEGDRPRPEGDRPRPDGARPRGEGDRPRPEGERPRGEGDRPRPEGDRPRPEGDRPRPEGERPRGE